MRNPTRGLLLGLFVVALVAACTASAAGPGVATLESQAPGAEASASPSLSPEDAVLAYAECMREHGIDMPDPEFETDANGGTRIGISGGVGGEADKDTFMAAEEACRHLLSAAMQERGRGQMSAEDEEKLLDFARCMREHGIDFPDPGAGGFVFEAGPGTGDKGRILDDPDFEAAQEACGELLPGRIGGEGPRLDTKPDGGAGTDEQVAP